MTYKTDIARAMRRVGLSRLVDSSVLRRATGVTIPATRQPSDEDQSATPSNLGINGPKLSVIVPTYNVEEYLANCLDSILGQSYTNLDVIVVNDGSTDQSGAIADSFARKHKRLRVIHKHNAGLGAARNTGLDYSDSEYVTFVDSDDTLPPDAYQTAMTSLLNTNSDVSIGSVERFDSRNKWLPFWVKLAHDEYRPAIHGLDFPPIMWDVFAWNKIYKRDTWDQLVGRFPEGTLYEDQECTAKLFVGGAKIDVLESVVYRWRLRDDNSSITQQKTNINDLSQRLDVMDSVESIISGTSDEYVDYWYSKTLGEDLYYYLREIPRADDDFFDLLSNRTRSLWENASDDAIAGIPPTRKALCYYVANKTKGEVTRLLVQFERTKEAYDIQYNDGEMTFTIPDEFGHSFALPEDLTRVIPDHITADAKIDFFDPRSNGDVVFEGFAKLNCVGFATGFSADLYDSQTDQVVATLEIEQKTRQADYRISDTLHSYKDAGFDLTIPHYVIDQIASVSNATQSARLTLRIHVHLGEHTWTVTDVKRDINSFAGYPHATEFTSRNHRLAIQGDPRVRTDLLVISPKLVASHIEIVNGELEVTLDSSAIQAAFGTDKSIDAYLLVQSNDVELGRSYFNFTHELAIARIPLPDLSLNRALCIDRHDLYVGSPNGMRTAIAVSQGQATRNRNADLQIGMSGFGYATLDQPIQSASVHAVEVDDRSATLTVTGSFTLSPRAARSVTPTLALVGSGRNIYPAQLSINSQTREYSAVFSLTGFVAPTGNRLESASHYILQLLLASGKTHPASSWVTTNVDLERSLPMRSKCGDHLLTVDPVGNSRSLRVQISAPLSPTTELGRWNESRNTRTFISPTRTISPNTVLFESFAGHSIGDSPLALNNEIARRFPSATRYWTVRSSKSYVPAGATPVIYGSIDWFDAVASSAVLINNNNFPYYFSKHREQIYLQTWHGTPLKRIGNDVPASNLSLSYRALMKDEAEKHWSFLLAQSPWAADTLSNAFGYSGDIIVEGYPRNDVLVDSSYAAARRNEVRKRLGISNTQTAILYAPTWRDNLKDRSGHYSMVDFLDVNKSSQELGKSSKILYRGHSNSIYSKRDHFSERVIDVSLYSDINDLILASDALITDYSSIMFDYVVTGKPIAFLCPDLDSYQEKVRGFYFDFESMAPGEILRSRKDAIELLRSSCMFTSQSTERYVAFAQKFASLDDGAAAERVVGQIGHFFS